MPIKVMLTSIARNSVELAGRIARQHLRRSDRDLIMVSFVLLKIIL